MAALLAPQRPGEIFPESDRCKSANKCRASGYPRRSDPASLFAKSGQLQQRDGRQLTAIKRPLETNTGNMFVGKSQLGDHERVRKRRRTYIFDLSDGEGDSTFNDRLFNFNQMMDETDEQDGVSSPSDAQVGTGMELQDVEVT